MGLNTLNRGQINTILTLGVACVVFRKKNGEARCMLATRDISIPKRFSIPLAYELSGMDRRNEKHKDMVVSVIDLEINDVRSFRLDRLSFFEDMGSVESLEDYNRVQKEFREFKETYTKMMKENEAQSDSLDGLDGSEEESELKQQKLLEEIGKVTLTI